MPAVAFAGWIGLFLMSIYAGILKHRLIEHRAIVDTLTKELDGSIDQVMALSVYASDLQAALSKQAMQARGGMSSQVAQLLTRKKEPSC